MDPIHDPARLESLRQTGLLDVVRAEEFDRVTEMAAEVLKVPVCLVSLVDSECQVFVGASGLPAPYQDSRRTPLSHSFCKHAVRARAPFIIRDARTDPRVAGNGAVKDLGVLAYLGFPLVGHDHQIYGTFCVIDSQPRSWTPREIRLTRDFTAIVADYIDHRSERQQSRTDLDLIIHDLKNPLSGVTMASAILQSRVSELPVDLQPLVEALSDASRRGNEMLSRIAAADRGHGEVCEDLPGRVSEVISRHLGSAREKGLNLEYASPPHRNSVRVAGWAVAQIVENLLSNAMKFTPSGGTVRISVEETGGHSRIEIADQGPGFSKGDRDRLFQRYARLSAEPTGGEESTGLGLSIVKKLVDQEGGTIELVSGPGEGARFRLVFPHA